MMHMGNSPDMDYKDGQDKKQSEFLCEYSFDWSLVDKIGVNTQATFTKVQDILKRRGNIPTLELKKEWYY